MSGERRYLTKQRDIALVDLVDRLLAGGVVITGDITLSLADIDLVYLNLRLVLGSASTVLGVANDDIRPGIGGPGSPPMIVEGTPR